MCVLVPRTRSSHISCCKSGCELRVQKGALENHRVASVPLIPKFASEVAARVCELRNPDTKFSVLFALDRPAGYRPFTERKNIRERSRRARAPGGNDMRA